MKHIINWFAGGFFRKLGNIFAYIILGVILSIILSKLDINLFNFMLVKADTNASYTSASYEVLQCEQNRTNCISDSANFNKSMSFGSNNGHIYRYQYLIYNTNGWDNGMYTITLGTYKMPLYFMEELSDFNFRFYANNRASSNGAVSGNDTQYISSFNCTSDDKGSNQDFYITCTFNVKTTIKFFMIEMYNDSSDWLTNTSSLYWWGIQDFKGIVDSTSAINNQTIVIQNEFNETNNHINDVNNSINNLNDTLEDTDVDDDVSDTLDFFSDFDVGELSSLTQIVLSPFQFLGQLVVGNTNDICFTLKGTRACLPNGQRMVWNKSISNCDNSYNFCPNSNGIELFKTFFNLVVGGFLSYKLLLKVFRTIHKALDPTENKVEVLNL